MGTLLLNPTDLTYKSHHVFKMQTIPSGLHVIFQIVIGAGWSKFIAI